MNTKPPTPPSADSHTPGPSFTNSVLPPRLIVREDPDDDKDDDKDDGETVCLLAWSDGQTSWEVSPVYPEVAGELHKIAHRYNAFPALLEALRKCEAWLDELRQSRDRERFEKLWQTLQDEAAELRWSTCLPALKLAEKGA